MNFERSSISLNFLDNYSFFIQKNIECLAWGGGIKISSGQVSVSL
ncbi:hypothetical protein pah_c030o002 [Parachlamydia acanthamoebae str. Hall's coccus]|nr:hypothetical protein pah_c030o002 [Parachlamydia acanthamoebae str. Hall's coccus]